MAYKTFDYGNEKMQINHRKMKKKKQLAKNQEEEEAESKGIVKVEA